MRRSAALPSGGTVRSAMVPATCASNARYVEQDKCSHAVVRNRRSDGDNDPKSMTSVFAVINNAKRRPRKPQPVDAALLALLAYLLALLAFFLPSFLPSLIYVSRQVSGGGNR